MNLSKDFRRAEFKCKCGRCDFDTVDAELILVLQEMRDHFNAPITVLSGCRCPAHNKAVGGAERSQHLLGRAADVQVSSVSPERVQNYLDSKYPKQYGLGRYATFTHIDTRSNKARWSS